MRPRSLPHNEDAEKALLCSVIRRPSLLDDLSWLTPEHFYVPANGTLLSLFRSLVEKRVPFDFVAIKKELEAAGQLSEVGGVEYLDELWDLVPTDVNWGYYAEKLRQCHHRRVVIQECRDLEERMYDQSLDAYEATVEVAEKTLTRLATQKPRAERRFKDIVMSTIEMIEKRYENRENPDVINFGIENLDAALGGLHPVDLCLICASTTVGKTALSGMAMEHAAQQGKGVAVFSLEMGAEQLVERVLARRSMVSFRRIRNGLLLDRDFASLTAAASKIAPFPIHVEDAFTMDINGLVSRCRQLHARHGIKLVIVDYLQLVSGVEGQASKKEDNRAREVANVSNRLKKMAGELGVTVIALSQLNDEGKIRESRAPSHDADVILNIVDKATELNPGLRDIIIAKQRNGPRGERVHVQFIGEHMDFKPVEKREEPESGNHHSGNGNGSKNRWPKKVNGNEPALVG
jgi:replicative DNA helicase